MGYNDNNGGSGGELIALGILAVISVPVVGGYGIYRLVQANKQEICSSCKKVHRNKELVKLQICWNPKVIKKYYRPVTEGIFMDFDIINTCTHEGNGRYSRYEEDEQCCSIRLKSNWPSECTVPNEFLQECDNYYGKKVCNDCAIKIYNDLIQRAKSLLEQCKICCPRCNDRFLPNELSCPTLSNHPRNSLAEDLWMLNELDKFVCSDEFSYVESPYPTLPELPLYWVAESFGDKEVCESCRDDILKYEHNRYLSSREKSSEIITHSANYKGKIDIDYSSAKNNIVSDYYENKNDALDELKLRAYLEGYDCIFNYACNNRETREDGNYKYSVYSATGSFAKRRV